MALTTINSDGVKDDSIVNADIKSDAAIAGTKVAPDFGSQNIATTGELAVSNTLECNHIKFLTANKFESSANVFEGKGTNGARLRSALSAETVPSFSNSDDTDTGMFLSGSDVLGLTTGGTDRFNISSSGQKTVKNGNLNINSTYIDFSGSLGSTPTTAAAIYRPADNNLAFSTANTERLRILNGGDVSIADGNLVVASGHGINFSASEGGTGTSSEASVLDDYETGIFTPSITFGNNNNNIGFSAAKGSYTKIGRRVFIDVVFNFSAKGDSTGVARLIDLPFTSLDQTVVRTHGFCSYYGNMFSLTGRPTLNHAGNSNKAVFYDDAASTQTTLNEANFANNSLLRLKVEYVCA